MHKMALSKETFLCVDIVLLFISLCAVILIGSILIIIFKHSSLYKNVHLHLIMILLVYDFFSLLTMIPYALTLIIGWMPGAAILNYPPFFVLLFASLSSTLATSSYVITVAIAIDRFHGLYSPIDYNNKNKQRYAIVSWSIATLCCIIELTVLYSTTAIVEHPGCPAFGCFISGTYSTFWSIGNGVINVGELLIMIAIIIRLYQMKMENEKSAVSLNKSQGVLQENIKNASRTTMHIIVGSALLVGIPSSLEISGRLFGLLLFRSIGPFAAVCGALSALYRAIVISRVNRDIRATMAMITNKCQNVVIRRFVPDSL